MKTPLLLKLAFLTLFATMAFGATYFSVSDKTKAGSVVLPAGDYSLTLKGSTAAIKDEHSGKVRTTEVKIQTGDQKFKDTTVHAFLENGERLIKTIDVGGSSQTLVFE